MSRSNQAVLVVLSNALNAVGQADSSNLSKRIGRSLDAHASVSAQANFRWIEPISREIGISAIRPAWEKLEVSGATGLLSSKGALGYRSPGSHGMSQGNDRRV